MPSEERSAQSTRLEPRVRYVSRNAVTKKWKRIPPTSCETIDEIIIAAKKQTRTKQKKNALGTSDIESQLQNVASRLMQQVPRMLFPPSTNDNDFDYEATLDRTSYLENQLTANQQSIHLLRAQIRKEEKLLKEDEEEADKLDQAFKSNAAFRRQQSKSLHTISKTIAGGLNHEQHEQRALATGKVDSQTNESSWAHDRDLQAILKQLRSHLGSMSNNISDVQQLDAEMQALHQDLSVFWHLRPVL